MIAEGRTGIRTVLVWAETKDGLTERIGTILGEFAAGADDVLHVGYAAVHVGWRDVENDGPSGEQRRELRLEYSALMVLRDPAPIAHCPPLTE
ncbi:MAG TPA: hypothetical protein VF533_18345 [Solirubrobacteraceae bacterium]|jgi:hypothetical protein